MGCLEAFSRRDVGPPVTEEESASIRKRCMGLLVQQAEIRPNLFGPIAGAIEMPEDLQRGPETTVSLATRAIPESSRIKPGVAGLERIALFPGRPPLGSLDRVRLLPVQRVNAHSLQRFAGVDAQSL